MFCGSITGSSPRQVPHLPQCGYGLQATTESLFLAKLSSSNVKAVALTRAPESECENKDISFLNNFHTQPGWPH